MQVQRLDESHLVGSIRQVDQQAQRKTSTTKFMFIGGLLVLSFFVGIPIAIFVVMPIIAQNTLDGTTVSLSNSTMFPCSGPYSWLINEGTIHIPGLFGATLHPWTTNLSTTTCLVDGFTMGGWHCDNPNTTWLGNYSSPEWDLSTGDNQKRWTADMTLVDSISLITGFITPMFAENQKARLIVSSNDVAISVFGIRLGSLTMRSEMTCEMVQNLPEHEIPADVCGTGQPTSNPGYVMHCVSGGDVPLTKPTTTPGPASSPTETSASLIV